MGKYKYEKVIGPIQRRKRIRKPGSNPNCQFKIGPKGGILTISRKTKRRNSNLFNI